MGAILALAAAATFGVADFAGGQATRRSPALHVTLVSNVAGGLVAVILAFAVASTWSTAALVWGAIGGVFGLVGLLLLYIGLATGPNRLVSPVSAVVSAVVPVAAGLAMGERPGTLAAIGLALTPLAVWTIAGGSMQISAEDRRSLLIALCAGAGFGMFFVCLSQTPDGAGAIPLVAARATSVALLLVAVGVTHRFRSRLRSEEEPAESATSLHRSEELGLLTRVIEAGLGLALLAGTLDMIANGLFLWATREGELVVVGALVSLFPATTIVLAVLILHERLERRQLVGIVLGLTAAVLLS